MDEILIVTQTNKLWFNADQCKPNCPAGASKKTNFNASMFAEEKLISICRLIVSWQQNRKDSK